MSDATADAPLSGLALIRMMMQHDAQPPIGKTLGFSLIEVDEGRAVFEGNPDGRTYNPLGGVHGGYAATLLDSACGIAVHTRMAPGQRYTTLELKVCYLRGMTAETGVVRAEGVVTAMGRRVAFTEAKLTDARGRLLANATSTLLVIND